MPVCPSETRDQVSSWVPLELCCQQSATVPAPLSSSSEGLFRTFSAELAGGAGGAATTGLEPPPMTSWTVLIVRLSAGLSRLALSQSSSRPKFASVIEHVDVSHRSWTRSCTQPPPAACA